MNLYNGSCNLRARGNYGTAPPQIQGAYTSAWARQAPIRRKRIDTHLARIREASKKNQLGNARLVEQIIIRVLPTIIWPGGLQPATYSSLGALAV